MMGFSLLFAVTIGVPFLVGHISYGNKLDTISLRQDERQSCNNVDCAGKDPCSSSAECSDNNKCCIDVINSRACCQEPGGSTPPASDTTTSSTIPFPLCDDYYAHPNCLDCACDEQDDCFPDEICCIEINGSTASLQCYERYPPTTPTTPTPSGGRCPATIQNPQCSPYHTPQPLQTCANSFHYACNANEICCSFDRDQAVPCCVIVA